MPLSQLPDSACSTSEATALERELLDEYRFGWQQLVELYGHASAVAVTKVPAHFARGSFNPVLGGETGEQGFLSRRTARQGTSGVPEGQHLQGGAWAAQVQALKCPHEEMGRVVK